MRKEGKYSYREEADHLGLKWVHGESGVEVVRLSPNRFMVRVPNQESRDILGSDAEVRAFFVAELFIEQIVGVST